MNSFRCLLVGLTVMFIGHSIVFGNLVSNADLESWSGNRPTNWSITGLSYCEHESSIRHGGNSSAKITVPTSTSVAEISQDISVQPGCVYTLSVWVYDNTAEGKIGLLINWRNENGSVSTITSSKSQTSSGWQKVAIYDREVPGSATIARIKIHGYKEDVGGGALYADDVQFVGDGSLPVTVSSFQGVFNNDHVQLVWSTDQESDISGFQLLKSNHVSGVFELIAHISPQYHQFDGMGGSYQFKDYNLQGTNGFWYKLEESLIDGTMGDYGPIYVSCNLEEEDIVSSLCGIYPNPFNPATKIRYRITNQASETQSLMIFDIKGQLIRQWRVNEYGAGEFVQIWDGRNQLGDEVAGGVYLVTLKTGNIYYSSQKILKLH